MPYIDLTDRFRNAFGILRRGINYGIKYNPEGFSFLTNSDEEFEDITLEFADEKLEFSSRGTLNPQSPLSNLIATPPIVSFSRQKKLITTPLQEDGAVVVERWASSQWSIRMQGIIIDLEHHHYPESRIRKLTKLFDFNGVVKVSGDRFYDKNIDSIYFTDVSIVDIPGYEDTVRYSLTAKSIKEVGFTLLNPN